MLVVVGVGGWFGWQSLRPAPGAAMVSRIWHRVQAIDLEIRITQDGELAAEQNIDILNEVEGRTTITMIVPEGSEVQKGDILVVLDASEVSLKLEDATLEVERATADLTNAQELLEIQKSQNAATLAAAEVDLTLAQLALRQYEEGAYPQQLANATTELRMAEINLKNKREDLAQTQRLYERGFVTGSDLQKAELDVLNAENSVTKAATALRVLTEYQHASDLAARQSALSQAEQRLARVKREIASSTNQREADVKARTQTLAIRKRRQERLQRQVERSVVRAPAPGLVLYGTTGNRNADRALAEGVQVSERTLLIRLPDTSSMKAVARVQESLASRVRMRQPATVHVVGQREPIPGVVSHLAPMADNSQRWWNPDLREYPIEIDLGHTPAGLKPGMSCRVEVLLERVEQVPAIPLSALFAVGRRRYAFVQQGDQIVARELRLGLTNDSHAQILEGVALDEMVLLLKAGEGRELAEKLGINLTPETGPGGGPPGGRRGRPGANSDGAPPTTRPDRAQSSDSNSHGGAATQPVVGDPNGPRRRPASREPGAGSP